MTSPRYIVFGDTVNLAAKMEASGRGMSVTLFKFEINCKSLLFFTQIQIQLAGYTSAQVQKCYFCPTIPNHTQFLTAERRWSKELEQCIHIGLIFVHLQLILRRNFRLVPPEEVTGFQA
jgi:uncharacterized protein Usg